jgi:hypothetical protein
VGGLLSILLDPDVTRITFEEHYPDAAPGTVKKLLAALEKVHLGCSKLGWTKAPCPITPELREWVKSFHRQRWSVSTAADSGGFSRPGNG